MNSIIGQRLKKHNCSHSKTKRKKKENSNAKMPSVGQEEGSCSSNCFGSVLLREEEFQPLVRTRDASTLSSSIRDSFFELACTDVHGVVLEFLSNDDLAKLASVSRHWWHFVRTWTRWEVPGRVLFLLIDNSSSMRSSRRRVHPRLESLLLALHRGGRRCVVRFVCEDVPAVALDFFADSRDEDSALDPLDALRALKRIWDKDDYYSGCHSGLCDRLLSVVERGFRRICFATDMVEGTIRTTEALRERRLFGSSVGDLIARYNSVLAASGEREELQVCRQNNFLRILGKLLATAWTADCCGGGSQFFSLLFIEKTGRVVRASDLRFPPSIDFIGSLYGQPEEEEDSQQTTSTAAPEPAPVSWDTHAPSHPVIRTRTQLVEFPPEDGELFGSALVVFCFHLWEHFPERGERQKFSEFLREVETCTSRAGPLRDCLLQTRAVARAEWQRRVASLFFYHDAVAHAARISHLLYLAENATSLEDDADQHPKQQQRRLELYDFWRLSTGDSLNNAMCDHARREKGRIAVEILSSREVVRVIHPAVAFWVSHHAVDRQEQPVKHRNGNKNKRSLDHADSSSNSPSNKRKK